MAVGVDVKGLVWAFQVVLTICVCCARGSPWYETFYLDDTCQTYSSPSDTGITNLDRNEGALVYSQRPSTYGSNKSCGKVFRGPAGTVLYVKSERLALGSGDCINFYDGGTFTDPRRQFCMNSLDHFTTTQSTLLIRFITSDRVTSASNTGFRLVITPIYNGPSCDYPYFRCNNGDCVGADMDGDGHPNCPDGSDESAVSCGDDMLSCGSDSEQCIASSWKCDRFSDCSNSWDEQKCVYRCDASTFECWDNSGCYEEYQRCDDYHYCSDGSDDENCDSCGEHRGGIDTDSQYVYCPSERRCMSHSDLCNGYPDCPTGEDEDNIICHPSIYWYWSGGQLAGLFIGFIIFVAVVVVIVATVHKKCRKEVT